MPRFRPEEVLRVLEAHGVKYLVVDGVAATLHGSPLRTADTDICPARDVENLERLASCLREIGAKIRSPDVPAGLPFACEAALLGSVDILNLVTALGDVDLCFVPAGTTGYEELIVNAVRFELEGVVAVAASLEDVIRSKEAANRPKDHATLPTLRALLERLAKS